MIEAEQKLYDDLKLYYKKVLVCQKCGEIYGSDEDRPKRKICPYCEEELKRKKKRKIP